MYKRALCFLLCLLLVSSLTVPAFAEETEATEAVQQIQREKLTISNGEQFLQFAQNCRLDSYSRYLNVTLTRDIDLTDMPFEAIPIFSGSLDGGGHTISGISIAAEGSVQGLFRYLTDTAVVKDLQVQADIQPQGSQSTVGGLAGSNAGTIQNCSFSGVVSGGDYVGGLVGVNTLTGVIKRCTADGEIHGSHFVGGIAGENQGVIRDCENTAQVNTTVKQNTVELSDITLDSLTDAEASNTVTDIGGIAGIGSGVIRSCINRGNVGYQQMGYNVGGIAGSQMGYISACKNYGEISGRKEVGGIAGQMEPVTNIAYTEDTLQTLQQQLDGMSGLTNRAAANAQNSASNISGQVAQLQSRITDAQDALESLMPDTSGEEIQLPDEDALLAAQNALSSSISGMQSDLSSITSGVQGSAAMLSSDLQAIAGQVNAMSETLSKADENIGGSITDVSDLDTEENLTGKIENCVNYGAVLADLNVGGIVGAMALENDLDPQEDISVLGDMSLNFETELRAVILNCENQASVTGKKQNVGGIAGWMELGLVKGCENFGSLESADYVGGIAGRSESYIRQCSVKCAVTGSTYAGGIAGSGTVVSDCRSMVLLEATEKLGEILGSQRESQQEVPVSGNYYLPAEDDLGGIDGISYDGCAQSLPMEEFLALEGLPEGFQALTVQFVFEDGSRKTISVAYGEALQPADIPELPEKEGYTAAWEDLHMDIRFDTTFYAVYTPMVQTLQSQQTGGNGLPVMLMEGIFSEEDLLELMQAEQTPVLSEGQVLEAWEFSPISSSTVLRCLLPENQKTERLRAYLLGSDGAWRETEFTADGSYAVVTVQEADQGICIVQLPEDHTLLYVTAAGVLLAAVVIVVLLCVKRKANA